MPACSIVVPAWNSEGTIEECLESVRNQTERDFECIIVDDGSTDGTVPKVLDAIDGDSRFLLLRQSHRGLSAARNAGIDAAASDIVLHLDSDDLAKPEMAEAASGFLVENDLDIAFFNAEPADCGLGEPFFDAERTYFRRKKQYGILSGREFLEEMLRRNDWVYASFLQASRKSRIRAPFRMDIRAQDEICTAENLLLAGKVGHLDRTLYVKRCFPSSAGRQRNRAHWAWCRMKAALELMRFADEKGIENPEVLLPIIGRMVDQVQAAIWKPKAEEEEWLQSLPFGERTLMHCLSRRSPHSSKYFSTFDKRQGK